MRLHSAEYLAQAGRVSTGSSVSAFTFQVFEMAITFDNEVEYIWRAKAQSRMKWLFLFCRYFPFSVLAINQSIIYNLQTGDPDILLYRGWYTYQAATTQMMLTAVEIVLVMRVYALYGRKRWVGAFLGLALVIEISAMVFSLTMTDGLIDGHVDESCMPRRLYFGAAAFFTHMSIAALTVLRNYGVGHKDWRQTPLVSLIYRDGALAFAIILALIVSTTIYSVTEELNMFANIMFSWYTSILSCAGCRLIANMQRLGHEEQLHTVSGDDHDTVWELTTAIDISDNIPHPAAATNTSTRSRPTWTTSQP